MEGQFLGDTCLMPHSGPCREDSGRFETLLLCDWGLTEKEVLVPGSGEHGVWNRALPKEETLLDLLTHFVGIGKTS